MSRRAAQAWTTGSSATFDGLPTPVLPRTNAAASIMTRSDRTRSGILYRVSSVRAGRIGDLSTIAALDAECTPERLSRLQRRLTESPGCLLVAVDDDQPGGPVIGYLALESSGFFGRDFIELVVVQEGHRRQGVGGALVASAFMAAASPTVFTSTNESNAPMRALLERDGWSLSGRLTGLDPNDPELVFFRRR